MLVATCIAYALGRVAGIQTLDTQTLKSKQLASPGQAIAVHIAPDTQSTKGFVIGVNNPVFVGIPLRQGGKTVGGLLSVGK